MSVPNGRNLTAAFAEIDTSVHAAEPQDPRGMTAESKGPRTKAAGQAQRPSQANILLELASQFDLFHAPDRTAYADIQIDNHRETWPLQSNHFRHLLKRKFYEATGGAASSEALQTAINNLEARALHDRKQRSVHLRVAKLNGCLYIDLADDSWRAVEIDAEGWRVVVCPPVRFRRSEGIRALPVPKAGGSVDLLRAFLNISSEDFVLVIAWILAALRPDGPYPLLVLSGEQGSSKSTSALMIRSLLDPRKAPLRALPRDERDLFVAADNNYVLAFDNVSSISPAMSDVLCRLASGGGFATRKLYTDKDELLIEAERPMIIKGIGETVRRPDLADRMLLLVLPPMADDKRRPKQELRSDFEGKRPEILGALLDAMVEGIRRLPTVDYSKLPRMADFAQWAIACEPAFAEEGAFMAAYAENRAAAGDTVLEADPVAEALRTFMDARTMWTGTATTLLEELRTAGADSATRSRSWPQSPQALSKRITQLTPPLRHWGIDVTREKHGRARTRMLVITNLGLTKD